jgi:cytochrome c oxidase subunit IV
MSNHIVPPKIYLRVWIALLLLLVLTWGVSNVDLGAFSILVAMAIAVVKMVLVLMFFMHVRYSSRMVRVFAGAGFVWLLIMITLTLSDYTTRGAVRPYNKSQSDVQMQIRKPGVQEKETARTK